MKAIKLPLIALALLGISGCTAEEVGRFADAMDRIGNATNPMVHCNRGVCKETDAWRSAVRSSETDTEADKPPTCVYGQAVYKPNNFGQYYWVCE